MIRPGGEHVFYTYNSLKTRGNIFFIFLLRVVAQSPTNM